jgi:hypothetical protein
MQKLVHVECILCVMLLFVTVTSAADFKLAKVVEVHDASSLAETAVPNHPVAVQAGQATTTSIPSQYLRCEITIALEGTNYTAVYPVSEHFKTTDFAAGDMISARIEGRKLVLKRLDGKEMKAKIARQEAAQPAPAP